MPRKPANPESRRSCRYLLRLTPAETVRLEARARAAGKTIADYLVRSVLGKFSRRKTRKPQGLRSPQNNFQTSHLTADES